MDQDAVLARLPFAAEELYHVRWSTSAPQLIAVGTTTSVHVVQLPISAAEDPRANASDDPEVVATFRLAARVTALAWSFSSECDSSRLRIELLAGTAGAAAGHGLYHLTYDSATSAAASHRLVSSPRAAITCCAFTPSHPGLAAVGYADGSVTLENLYADEPGGSSSLVGRWAAAVEGVLFHEGSAGLLGVYTADGALRLLDWQKERRPLRLAFSEPSPPAASAPSAATGVGFGEADWSPVDSSVLGAFRGGRWSVWDMRRANGGRALSSEVAWEGEGARGKGRFKWCPTDKRKFAVACSGAVGASVKLINTSLPAPKSLVLPSEMLRLKSRVQDLTWSPFDWPDPGYPSDAVPRPAAPDFGGDPALGTAVALRAAQMQVLCVAVGKELVWLRAT